MEDQRTRAFDVWLRYNIVKFKKDVLDADFMLDQIQLSRSDAVFFF